MEQATESLTRSELIEIFTRWDKEAAEGNWEAATNPEASADKFLELAAAVKDQ